MATWVRGRFSDSILERLDSQTLTDAAEGLQSFANGAAAVAEMVRLAEQILLDDPLTQAMGLIGGGLQGLLDDIEQTDIYALPHLPHSWGDLLHPYSIDDVQDDLVASISDDLDPNRPLFGPGAPYAAVTVLVGADNWMDFRRLVKLLGELFSGEEASRWARLADIRFQFDRHRRRPIPRAERGSAGATWDWYTTNWVELVPPVGRALQAIRDFIDTLVSTGVGLATGLSEAARMLAERAEYIAMLAEEVAHVAEFLAKLRELIPQSSLLFHTSENGGTTKMLGDFISAGNRPEHRLCAGFTLFTATGDPVEYFKIVQRLLGVQYQAVAGQAEAVADAAAAIDGEN